MAESSNSITFLDLKKEVGHFLGWGRTDSAWSAAQLADIVAIVNAGYRQFLNPPPLKDGEEPHRWYFLELATTLSTSSSTADLPDDFGGVISELSYAASSGKRRITLADEAYVRGLLASSQSGPPQVACVRIKTMTATVGQRYQLLVAPTPDTSYTLGYRYAIQPPKFNTDADYAVGGGMHGETITESCLAIAESRKNDEAGIHWQLFLTQLAASIRVDKATAARTPGAGFPLVNVSSTMAQTYHDLLRDVGRYMWGSADVAGWTAEQEGIADSIVQRGYRQFCFPPAVGEMPSHEWTFLRITAALSVSDFDTDLPLDFSGKMHELNHAAASTRRRVPLVSEEHIRALRSTDSTTGIPQVACVRAKAISQLALPTYELLCWPSGTSTTLTARYTSIPVKLTSTNLHPVGGIAHAETLLASCIAVAEVDKTGQNGAHWNRFMLLLGDSIRRDQAITTETSEASWPQSGTSTTLAQNYADLVREAGNALGYGLNTGAYDTAQFQHADATVQEGLRQFYYPPQVGEKPFRHRWSFLRITASITASADEDLPTDFGGGLSEFAFASGGNKKRVKVVSIEELTAIKGADADTGDPQYAAIRLKAVEPLAEPVYEVLFYPTGSASLTYQYNVKPPKLDATDKFPLGGVQHAQTVLASVLAVAELKTKGVNGPAWERFLRLLQSSIDQDVQVSAVSDAVQWPQENTSTTLDQTFYDLLTQVGHELGYGFNSAAWTVAEQEHVDAVVQRGVRQFYNPPLLPGEFIAHEWTFLRPVETLTTAEDTSTYTLPSNFGSIIGRITFDPQLHVAPIEIIGEGRLRELQQRFGTSIAKPQYAAIRAKEFTASTGQRWEVVFWPTPDAAYELAYQYRILPAKLTTAGQYPHGGVAHAETVLASCLAVAERDSGKSRKWQEYFIERLTASVAQDCRSRPEKLGYNADTSDDGKFDFAFVPLATYNGVLY